MYASTDPMTIALWACGVLAFGCWIVSLFTGNYSQVDRLWSIAPPLYAVHFAAHAGFSDARLNLMAFLVVAWGGRLTFNFARKGGYRRGGEDYRWPEVRREIGPVAFQLLNATFIAPLQNLLLLGLVAPCYVAYRMNGTPLGSLDWLAAAAFILFVVGEGVADEQQWRFQCWKQARKSSGRPVYEEFLTTGLFRYSRHPNFFCEQAIWWSFYLFAVAASGSWIGWTIAGPLVLTALFQGSTSLTERLTLRKYPSYAQYRQRTSRLVPLPPRR
jgi:steroid 5-alpha reductase family enzyme